MKDEDPFNTESRGASVGNNPIFGDWGQSFAFPPVPYGSRAAKRGEFRTTVQECLTNNWLYSSEIRLEIMLFLDTQTVLETNETADLDNYAKSILDALKGPKGIMIDDTQVQSLTISWTDTYQAPSFQISARGGTDDFIMKPQEFYEMPDGLWYPHGPLVWEKGKTKEVSSWEHYLALTINEQISFAKRRVRAGARKRSSTRLRAYQLGKFVSPSARGFHRSRIDDDFETHSRRSWQKQRQTWIENNPEEARDLITCINQITELYTDLSTLVENEMR